MPAKELVHQNCTDLTRLEKQAEQPAATGQQRGAAQGVSQGGPLGVSKEAL